MPSSIQNEARVHIIKHMFDNYEIHAIEPTKFQIGERVCCRSHRDNPLLFGEVWAAYRYGSINELYAVLWDEDGLGYHYFDHGLTKLVSLSFSSGRLTYQGLADIIATMNEEQKQSDATVYITHEDESYAVGLRIGGPKIQDVLDEDHPYLYVLQ